MFEFVNSWRLFLIITSHLKAQTTLKFNPWLWQSHLNNITGPWAKHCTVALTAQPLTEITM